jgi:hypothetical protein
MGTREILLIVLGVIIISLAIFIGMHLFTTSAEHSNRDQIMLALNSYYSDAQAYYKKTTNMGGGGGSYTGWSISKDLKKKGDVNGTFTANVKAQQIIITAKGRELGKNGKTTIQIKYTIKPSGVKIKTVN